MPNDISSLYTLYVSIGKKNIPIAIAALVSFPSICIEKPDINPNTNARKFYRQ